MLLVLNGATISKLIANFILLSAAAAVAFPSPSNPESEQQLEPAAAGNLAVTYVGLKYGVTHNILAQIWVELALESRDGGEKGQKTYMCVAEDVLRLPFYPSKVECQTSSKFEQSRPTLSMSIKGNPPKMPRYLAFLNRPLVGGPLVLELTYQDEARTNGEEISVDVEIPTDKLKRAIKIWNKVFYRSEIDGKVLATAQVPF